MLDFGESTELTTRIEVNWRRHTNQKPTRLVWYSIWYNPPKSYPHPFVRTVQAVYTVHRPGTEARGCVLNLMIWQNLLACLLKKSARRPLPARAEWGG